MPLFRIEPGKKQVRAIEQKNFGKEKDIQTLVEGNLHTMFNCRFVASELTTGPLHAGRIDTLALSEDGNPVIIEYKKVESSDLVNQSLFYLSWLNDHRGDFQISAQRALGNDVAIDWSDIRVICIAPNYRKYDLHAVQMMGANIELWRYRLFVDGSLSLEEVFRRSYASLGEAAGDTRSSGTLTPGQKAALTRATGSYTYEEHVTDKPKKIRGLAEAVREYILGLDPAIEENPRKFYVAYKISQNIVCMEVQKSKIALFLKINIRELRDVPPIAKDVSEKGHYGTGDTEVAIRSLHDLEAAKPLIELSYNKVGS